MSLDLYLREETCKHCEREGDEFGSWNYTYNVGPMWRLVFPGEGLVEIDGMTGAESLAKLDKAISAMEMDPATFAALNPENGWGSFETFLPWLKQLRSAAAENPTAVWSAWR